MRDRSLVVRLSFLLSLSLAAVAGLGTVGCGAATPEAKAEANPWADYKGTYASSADPKGKSSASKPESKEGKAKAAEAPKEEEAAPVKEAKPAPLKKSASKTTIHGESISSIGAESLADVSKSALKSKVLSSKVIIGSQYEQLQIKLNGVDVKVIRPASSPDASGPAISSPKAKNDTLSKTETAWYDEEADVLIVVSAAKKPAAQKALGAILER